MSIRVHLAAALIGIGAALALTATARGEARWAWPVEGEVVSGFEYRATAPFERGQHRGVDIAAAVGTPVRAVCSGTVRHAGPVGDAGTVVSTLCEGNVVSYLHLGSAAVEPGEVIARGERVGTVGTSGRPAPGPPHLHLGVRRASDRWGYVDPLTRLGDDRVPPPVPGARRRGRPRPLGEAPRAAPAPAPVAAPTPVSVPARDPAGARGRGSAIPWPAWLGAGLLVAGLIPWAGWRTSARAETGCAPPGEHGRRNERDRVTTTRPPPDRTPRLSLRARADPDRRQGGPPHRGGTWPTWRAADPAH